MITIAFITMLIPATAWAIKVLIEVYGTPKAQYIRNRKGQFMSAEVKMWKPDYKNSWVGHPVVYKLVK